MATEPKIFDPKKGINNVADRGPSTFLIDPREIEVDEAFNTRKIDLSIPAQRTALDELKVSWEVFGQLQPVVVRYDAGKAKLVFGYRRWLACCELIAEGRLKEPLISITVTKANDEGRRKAIDIVSNISVPLNDVERGEGFQAMIDRKISMDKIVAMMPFTPAYIRACLKLADSPVAVKEMVRAGAVTSARAIQAVAEKGDRAVAELEREVAQAKSEGRATVTRTRMARTKKEPAQLQLERTDTDSRIAEAAEEVVRSLASAARNAEPGAETLPVPVALAAALAAALFGMADGKTRAIAAVSVTAETEAA